MKWIPLLLSSVVLLGCSGMSDPKAEDVLKKLSEGNQLFAQTGFLDIPSEELRKKLGEPDDLQLIDASAVLYYECSDGTIQIIANRPMYTNFSRVMGKVNVL